jgi:hypothetical protein
MKQEMKWMEHVVRVGERRGEYRILVGKPEEGKPLRRPKMSWKDNIRNDREEVASHGLD